MLKKKFIIISTLFVLLIANPAYAINLEKKWSFDTGEEIIDLYVKNIDSDKPPEIIVYSKNHNIHKDDNLIVLNYTGGMKWNLNLGDIKSIHATELGSENPQVRLFVSYGRSSEGIEKGNLLVLDGKGTQILKYPTPSFALVPVMIWMKAFDLDGNGYNELIGGTMKGVYALNDRFNGELWTVATGEPVRDFIIDDIDRNGEYELITQSVGIIYNINLKKGLNNWVRETGEYIKTKDNESNEKNTGITFLKVGDVELYPNLELITVSNRNIFLIYNHLGELISIGGDSDMIRDNVIDYENYTIYEAISDYGEITALELYDFNKDGLMDLVFGTKTGLYVWDIISDEYVYEDIGEVRYIHKNNEGEIIILTDKIIHRLDENKQITETYELDEGAGKIIEADIDGAGEPEFILYEGGCVFVYGISPEIVTTTSSSTTTTSSSLKTTISSTSTSSSTTLNVTLTLSTTTTDPSIGEQAIEAKNIISTLLIIAFLIIVTWYGTKLMKERKRKKKKEIEEKPAKKTIGSWEDALAEREESEIPQEKEIKKEIVSESWEETEEEEIEEEKEIKGEAEEEGEEEVEEGEEQQVEEEKVEEESEETSNKEKQLEDEWKKWQESGWDYNRKK